MNNNFHTTHNQFFKRVYKHTLNELYRRANKNTRILENDINCRLKGYNVQVNINNNCHIYINFYKNNIKIGHVSLHIESKNHSLSNKAKKYGRFHAAKNINPNYYTFKLNKNNKNIFITYNKSKYIHNEFKYILDTVLLVLNEYFNPSSSLSLNNYDSNYIDNCTQMIAKKIHIRNSLNITRKQSHKLQS
jgi:hypothetical protein